MDDAQTMRAIAAQQYKNSQTHRMALAGGYVLAVPLWIFLAFVTESMLLGFILAAMLPALVHYGETRKIRKLEDAGKR